MFNNFNLINEEIVKIINDYKPLIIEKSILNDKINEDLKQEIEILIFRKLTKNRKK